MCGLRLHSDPQELMTFLRNKHIPTHGTPTKDCTEARGGWGELVPAGKASWKREALSWTLCLGRIWRKNEETRAESQDFGVTKSNPVLNHLSSVQLWVSPVTLVVKILPAHAGDLRDAGSIPGSGRSPGGRNSNPLQYSCLENPVDRGGWWATIHRVAKS